MSRMKNRKGFTLIEVMMVSMLTCMLFFSAFPLIKMGLRVTEQRQKQEAVQILGDGMFDAALELMTQGERIEVWKKLRTIFSNDEYKVLWEMWEPEENWMVLHVNIMDGKECVYEREEMIPVLNMELYDYFDRRMKQSINEEVFNEKGK